MQTMISPLPVEVEVPRQLIGVLPFRDFARPAAYSVVGDQHRFSWRAFTANMHCP